jgi:cardiolipin synthase
VDDRAEQASDNPAGVHRYRRALEGLVGIPATEGNQVEVLRNGDEIFPAMMEAVRAATHTIDFHTFIYWEGSIGKEFAETVAERAGAGVRVRVLLDAAGAHTIDPQIVPMMEEAGAQVEWFRPLSPINFWQTNHRTHRKVLICDEDVAFTGGVGIADEWRGDARDASEWRDTHFRVRGPVVDGLRGAFVGNWAETGRPLFEPGVDRFPEQPRAGDSVVQVVRGMSETGWSDITTVVRSLLELAERRVRIATAYFMPDDRTLQLLCETAQRGVEVELLLPGPHRDKRFCQLASESEYEPLLEAGVGVYAFQPTMLHTKVMTVDGMVANVGTANINSRSLSLDEEVNLVVFDAQVVGVLDAHFDDDLARSQALDPAQWADRGLVQRAKEQVARAVGREL